MPLELELGNLELEHLHFSIAIRILFLDQLRLEFYNFEPPKKTKYYSQMHFQANIMAPWNV